MRAHSKIYGLIVAQVQYAKKLSRTSGYRNKTGDSAVVVKLKLTGNDGERLIEVQLNDKVQFYRKEKNCE